MAFTVNWSQAGAAPQRVMLLESITVEDFVKESLDLNTSGFEVLVNGCLVDGDELLEANDIITLNPKKSTNG